MSRQEELKEKLEEEMEGKGYYFNPDEEHTLALLENLLVNEERYGYMACPCRLASGDKEKDMDIICPCDYRDDDVADYGTCFCGLYVDEEVSEGRKDIQSIPERRNLEESEETVVDGSLKLAYPVYRCKVCGYLCARNRPPSKCPICGVPKERFEQFL